MPYLHRPDTTHIKPNENHCMTHYPKYILHLKFFLGENSSNGVVKNIIRLLHHPAISFCH